MTPAQKKDHKSTIYILFGKIHRWYIVVDERMFAPEQVKEATLLQLPPRVNVETVLKIATEAFFCA